jgi:hypothetical protein
MGNDKDLRGRTIYAALLEAKKQMINPKKKSTNEYFRSKYADLSTVMEAAIPALHDAGIVVQERVGLRDEGGGPVLEMSFVLVGNPEEKIGSFWPLIPEKKTPQGYGSALTYGRRYLLQTMCGLSAEDDDGNAASQQPQNQPKPEPRVEPVVDGTQLVTQGHILDVKTQSGTRSNGKKWTRYGIKLDSNEWFNTFDKAAGEKAMNAKGDGTIFELYYTKSECGKYNNLETLYALGSQPDPDAEENEQNNRQGDNRIP